MRLLAVAVLLYAGATPALAQVESGPARRLEPRWQTAISAESKGRLAAGRLTRMLVADDGRISFGLNLHPGGEADSPIDGVLITATGNGEILNRATVQGDFGNSAIVPLAGGDFLVQGRAGGNREALELRRLTPDGRIRFSSIRRVDGDNNALRDAVALADGRTVALSEIGPGPNAILVLDVLDPAGRSADLRQFRVMLGSAQYTRMFRVAAGPARERVVVAVNGDGSMYRNRPDNVLLRPFAFQGRTVSAEAPVSLGREGEMRCVAVAANGITAVGIVPSAATSTVIRWHSAGGKLAATRTFAGVPGCAIAAANEGGSLVLLGQGRILAFAPSGAAQWSAELPPNAEALAWMPGGDIVVLHSRDGGLRLVRYVPR